MPSFPPPRRHSTVPSSFQPDPQRTATGTAANGSVETLYNHPSVRIVAFTAGKSAFDRPGPAQEEKPGTLPSSSQFERPIAVGAFQIYRAPGSVAFLRSGTALQPILPKSQAWCLDEQSSKFVLQIRRPNYWRIEVPVGNDEEIRTAHKLREVLDKILQFEKTPCPFERSFTVELPEPPKTPIKKRTWTPPARTVSMNWPPGSPVTPPPEFASRARFYNPGARRFSDFGADTSRIGMTPLASPQMMVEPVQEDVEKKADTPSRRERRDVSSVMCGPLLEEPEPLSPPLTAVPLSIAQITEASSSKAQGLPTAEPEPATQVAQSASLSKSDGTSTAKAPVKKRDPIWTTKKAPPRAARKSPEARTAITTAPSADITKPTATRREDSTRAPRQTDPGRSPSPELESVETSPNASPSAIQNDMDNELQAEGGALEGSGQLRVRRTRLAAFASRRAATTPALRLRTPSTSTLDSVKGSIPETQPEEPSSPAESSAESLDSFHSLESWHEPLSPPAASPMFSPSKTYPYPHENIPLALNRGQISGFTTTPTVSAWERNSVGAVISSECHTPDTPFTEIHEEDRSPRAADKASSKPSEELARQTTNAVPITSKAILEEDISNTTDTESTSTSWSSAASHTSSDSPIRHRAATTSVAISHRSPRGLSPLPPAANLLTTSNNRTSSAVRAIRRIPSSIFNTTCEILISPPAHLISLMLKVAARITAGEWRGFVFGMGEGGELVDVRWDWSDDRDLIDSSWEEDDFGFGKAHRVASKANEMPRKKLIEYQDPWATNPDDPDLDEDGHWSRSWGVD